MCRYGRLWRERARQKGAAHGGTPGAGGPAMPILERQALVAALLLNRASEEVRSATVVLLERICRQQEHLRFRLLDLLVSLLPLAADAGALCCRHSLFKLFFLGEKTESFSKKGIKILPKKIPKKKCFHLYPCRPHWN